MSDELQQSFSSRIGQPDLSKVWVGLSFLVSSLILIWAFSLPFQSSGQTKTVLRNSGKDPGEVLRRRRIEADEFRAVARSMDSDLMREVARRREASRRPVPGIENSKKEWKHRVTLVRKQIDQLAKAEQGTLEWGLSAGVD